MKIWIVCRRELRSYFSSYVAWGLLAIFMVLTGGFFYSNLSYFLLISSYVLPTGLWQQVFLDVRYCAMIVLPLMTMRSFAEERKLGTIELLWTYPARDFELVAGKFLACWLFYVLALALTAAGPIMLYRYFEFAVGPLLSAYLGVLLLGTGFIACGLFVSSLTENQVLAAMGTYGLLVFFWFVTWNEAALTDRSLSFLLRISLFDRFLNFARGVIDTKDILFFVFFTALFLFLTLQSLGARKWRGVA